MILVNLGLSILCLIVLIKFADYAILYSSKIARALHIHEFMVSFFIVALVSVLPEAAISIISAVKGDSQLGLGTLIGSSIADLTLVFGIVSLFSYGGIKVKSKTIEDSFLYLILLLFPLLLGFDGKLSRVDGVILILAGAFFFFRIYKGSKKFSKEYTDDKPKPARKKEPYTKSLILLIVSLTVVLVSAFFTVKYIGGFAEDLKIPSMLVGITILALGTCLPELAFSIKAVRRNKDDLALGDILGTVVTDGTIVLGLVALINPFSYNPYKMYLLGGTILIAGIFVFSFMKSNKSIDKKEGLILIFFYILFIMAEFLLNKIVNF